MQMKINAETAEQHEAILNCLNHPAFLVRENVIVLRNYCADAAEAAVKQLLAESGVEPGMTMQSGEWIITTRRCGSDMIVLAQSRRQHTAMAAAAAHAIRMPVSNLYGALTALSAELAEEERCGKLLAEMYQSIYQLVRAQGNIDAIAFGETPLHTEETDLTELVRQLCERAQDGARLYEMTISLELPAQPLRFRMDRAQIERALLNLLSNAVSFGVHGTEILVRVGVWAKYAMIEICNRVEASADPWAELTGTSERLGMNVVRMIAKAHGGVLLSECREDTYRTKLTLSMDGGGRSHVSVDSPGVDYAGGFERVLLEFSTILPASEYDPRGL